MYRFLSLIILVFVCSCAPRIYLPDRVNAPMLREAGEVNLTSSLKIQNSTNSSNFSVSPSFDFAVSPIKNLGIIAGYRHTSRYTNDDNSDNYYQDSAHYTGNKYELGLGYYLPFGNRGLFNIYGGGGLGTIKRQNLRPYDGNYDAKYYQIFLQPSIGFEAGKVFDFCGGIRMNYHKYYDFNADSASYQYSFTNPSTNITYPFFLLLDPFINLNIGYQYVKFNIQFGANFTVGKPGLSIDNPMYLSMGLSLNLAPRFLLESKKRNSH